MRITTWATCFFALAAGACSGVFGSDSKESKESAIPNGNTGSEDGGDAGTSNSNSGSSADGSLKIVNLSATSPVVTGGAPLATETGTVTFAAIVTSKNGLDSIAGGQLLDESGKTYAPFSSGSTKGTYAAQLTWDQINQGASIDFAPGDSAERKFVAKFFDNDGNDATASVTLSLKCRLNATKVGGACGGLCVESLADSGDNCGACGTRCAAGTFCSNSVCNTPTKADLGGCFSASQITPDTTCSTLCGKVGLACFEGKQWPAGACNDSTFYGLGCSASPRTFIASFPLFRCICSQ